MSPVRQHLIAQLAVGAFFDSVLAPDEAARAAAWGYLRKDLGRDFPEARYAERTAGSPARPLGMSGSLPVPRWPGRT